MFEDELPQGDYFADALDSDGSLFDDPFVDDPALVSFIGDRTAPELLAELHRMPPSLLVLDALITIDRATLSPPDAVTFLQVLQRVQARLAVVEAEALVAAAAGHPRVEELLLLDPNPERDEVRKIRIQDACREEIAAALRLTQQRTQSDIDRARLLAGPLADTREAMTAGDVTRAHADVVVAAAERLPGALVVLRGPIADDNEADRAERQEFARSCARLQARVLPVARRATVADTKRCAERAVLAIDAEGQARRRRQALPDRDVYVSPDVDGLSVLVARMATEQAQACFAALQHLAHSPDLDAPCGATIGERRVQAMVDTLVAATSSTGDDAGTSRPGPRTHLDIVIDLPTLLGLRDQLDGSEPAHLIGAGPLNLDAVRDLLADPTAAVTLRRLVTDPVTGHLLDCGRTTYQAPARLRDFINARDRVCRFPGCNRAASRCQLDHVISWNDGGETRTDNLGPLCVRHHQLKTHAHWDIIESHADGRCTWRSPQGRRYDVDPPPF